MQEIFFFDQGDDLLPREDVRIQHARAEPYPDGGRVRITIELTTFADKPNLSLTIIDSSGETVSEAEILEIITPKIDLTMHIRQPEAQGEYTLRVELYYDDSQPQDIYLYSFSSTGED